jgi:hypothetical protein
MPIVTLSNNFKVTTFTPSRDFEPLGASSAELQKFGFPPMPDDDHHRARYENVVKRLKGKLNYIQPTFRVHEDIFHGPRKRPTDAGTTPQADSGTETFDNWSGGVVFAPARQSFSWVQGDWVIPDVDAPTENMWYYCANWIGIDGDGSGDVCQIGIECEVYRSGTSITRNIYPWWEWYPLPEVKITNFTVNPGDMVTALLCAGPGAGATKATAYFTNRTTGDSTSFSFNAPAGTTLVGNCAEWIVEAPTVGGQQSSCADYGEVFFSTCEAVLGNGTTVNGGTGDNINMKNSAGTIVSQGNIITPTIIQCEYVGALP